MTAAGGFKKHSLLLLQNAAGDLGCGAPSLTFPQTHTDCSTYIVAILYSLRVHNEYDIVLWVVFECTNEHSVFCSESYGTILTQTDILITSGN